MFCPNCGARLTDGTRFCNSCGTPIAFEQPKAPAAPVYQAPAAPVYQAPAAPVYNAPAQPVYQAPAAPVYQAPAPQPVKAAAPDKFPTGALVMLILCLVTEIGFLIARFAVSFSGLAFGRYLISESLFLFGLILMIVAVCLKQKAPWLFGVGVIFSGLLTYLLNLFGSVSWYAVASLLIVLLLIAPIIHYFLRGKLKGVKNALVIVCMLVALALPVISFVIQLVEMGDYVLNVPQVLVSMIVNLLSGLTVPLLYFISVLAYSSRPRG